VWRSSSTLPYKHTMFFNVFNISIAQVSIWIWSNARYNSRGNQINIAKITNLQLLFYKSKKVKSNQMLVFYETGKPKFFTVVIQPLSTCLIKPNSSCFTLPSMQHHSFLIETRKPLITGILWVLWVFKQSFLSVLTLKKRKNSRMITGWLISRSTNNIITKWNAGHEITTTSNPFQF